MPVTFLPHAHRVEVVVIEFTTTPGGNDACATPAKRWSSLRARVLDMVDAPNTSIRVKSMLIAPNRDRTAHAVSLNHPTIENPGGYHRLIGGEVEVGEPHRDALLREVDEELGATVRDLTFLTTVESIFRINGRLGHEVVFLYAGHLEPAPPPTGAVLTESDGAELPVVWRPLGAAPQPLPLYPAAAATWVHDVLSGSRF